MRKQLLLAATLGALAMVPPPGSAHAHDPVHPNVGSSFGIRIVVRDGPKVVHNPHNPGRHLRPQPWPRHFKNHAPSARWHGPWHHRPRHFHGRDRDHRPWFRTPGAQHFKHGDGKRWLHAPWRHGRPAVRNHFPHARFKHGHPGSGPRRHR
jgi:hypothetical protein